MAIGNSAIVAVYEMGITTSLIAESRTDSTTNNF
jgi:hypothetical protein